MYHFYKESIKALFVIQFAQRHFESQRLTIYQFFISSQLLFSLRLMQQSQKAHRGIMKRSRTFSEEFLYGMSRGYKDKIIIIGNMKKSNPEYNPSILNKKQNRREEIPKTTQDLRNFDKNSKNFEFTGLNVDRIQREYYPQSARTSEASCSIIVNGNFNPLEKQEEQTKASKDKSNNSSYFSKKAQLQNQIQRLTLQLNRKNQQISEIVRNQEKKKSEIVELNKIINFHLGQISIKEAQLKSYEQSFIKLGRQCDQKSKYKSQVEELVFLFEGMRKENQELSGNIQQKTYQLNKLTEKYLKLKEKVHQSSIQKSKFRQSRSLSRSQSQRNKLINSESLSKRVYESGIGQKERKTYLWTLHTKIAEIEAKMLEISSQNVKLFQQIEQKDQLIQELQIKLLNFQLESKEKQNIINTLRKHTSQKKMVHKIHRKQDELQKHHRSKRILKISPPKNINSNNPQSSKLFHHLLKLKYNLITSQVSYEELINNLMEIELKQSIFLQSPYFLTQEEYTQVLKWVKNLKKKYGQQNYNHKLTQEKENLRNDLRETTPIYFNIGFKKQLVLKRLIFNEYLNREQEFDRKINEYPLMSFSEADEYYQNWGLSPQQRDILFKSYFDLTNQILQVNLGVLKQLILSWQNT